MTAKGIAHRRQRALLRKEQLGEEGIPIRPEGADVGGMEMKVKGEVAALDAYRSALVIGAAGAVLGVTAEPLAYVCPTTDVGLGAFRDPAPETSKVYVVETVAVALHDIGRWRRDAASDYLVLREGERGDAVPHV